MVRLGTMRNGVIVPDDGSWPTDCPPPPTTETREEFLQNLRDDIVAVQAGARGKPVAEAFARIRADLAKRPIGC